MTVLVALFSIFVEMQKSVVASGAVNRRKRDGDKTRRTGPIFENGHFLSWTISTIVFAAAERTRQPGRNRVCSVLLTLRTVIAAADFKGVDKDVQVGGLAGRRLHRILQR
jgi:hypothetical protein